MKDGYEVHMLSKQCLIIKPERDIEAELEILRIQCEMNANMKMMTAMSYYKEPRDNSFLEGMAIAGAILGGLISYMLMYC